MPNWTRIGRRGRWVATALVALMVAMVAVACKTPASRSASSSGSDTPAGQGSYPVTVTDCNGVTSTFTAPPKRVANLTRATLEMLFYLGVQGSIIGTQPPPPGALPSQFDAAAQKIPSLSGPYKANSFKPVAREVLLGANPDFVIGGFKSNFDTAGATSQKELTQRGINSYFAFSTACTSALSGPQTNLDLVYKDLDNLGKIFGVEQAASELTSQMNGKVATVQHKIQSDASRPSVFVFEYDQGTTQLAEVGNRQTANAVIDLAGGRNLFDDQNTAYGTTGWEEVIKRNPDFIMLEITGATPADMTTETDAAKAFLQSYAPIQSLPAVKDKRFVVIPDWFDAIGGVRNADGVEALARALHPGDFS